MTTTNTDRMLNSWFEEAEPHDAPGGLLAGVFAVTRRTAQRRGLSAWLHAAIADTRVLSRLDLSPAVTIGLLVALMIALLIGAVVAGGRLFQVPETGWRVLDASDAQGGYTWISQVTAGGPGLVAVGTTIIPTDGACGRETHGRIWSSANGNEWADTGAGVFDDIRLEQVVASGGRLYAIGVSNSACGSGSEVSHATWSSADGVSWEPVASSAPLDGSYISSLLDADGVPLAIGHYQEPDPPDGSGIAEARVWALTDGAWELVATLRDVSVRSAAANGHVMVACCDDTTGQASVWYSEDAGRTWSAAQITSLDQYDLSAVTAAEGRLVVFGAEHSDNGQPLPVTLSSTDGKTWVVGEPPAGAAVSRPGQVWSSRDGFVAVGPEHERLVEPAECAATTPASTAYQSGAPEASVAPEPSSAAPATYVDSPLECTRIPQTVDGWVSDDGLSWRIGAQFPGRGNKPGPITQPIPASSYSLASANGGLVVTNPSFGARLWYVPLSDFGQATQ